MTLDFKFYPPSYYITGMGEDINEIFGHKDKGFPLGCMTEIIGDSQVGKTSLVYKLIGKAQSQGYNSLYFDTDYTYDQDKAEEYGVDISSLLLCQSNDLSLIVKVILEISDKDIINLIWIDSLSLANIKENTKIGSFKKDSPEILKARYLDRVLMELKDIISSKKLSILFVTYPKTNYNNNISALITSSESKSLSLSCDIRVLVKKLDINTFPYILIENICNRISEPFIKRRISLLT